jgi:ABC-type oligopeptide transport system substrate-binding subunit
LCQSYNDTSTFLQKFVESNYTKNTLKRSELLSSKPRLANFLF